MVLGDADPVVPQLLGIPRALDHSAKGAQARVAVVGTGRHRPLPRQVGRSVVPTVFKIRHLHFAPPPLSGYACRYSPRAGRRRAATRPRDTCRGAFDALPAGPSKSPAPAPLSRRPRPAIGPLAHFGSRPMFLHMLREGGRWNGMLNCFGTGET